MATYTHKFNLHSHFTKWETPTLIVQYIQSLQKDICIAILMSQADFTDPADLTNFDTSLENTINSSDDTQAMYFPTSDANSMGISPTQAHIMRSNRNKIMQAGISIICGEHSRISRD